MIPARTMLKAFSQTNDIDVSLIDIGEANASIASKGEMIIGTSLKTSEFVKEQVDSINQRNPWFWPR